MKAYTLAAAAVLLLAPLAQAADLGRIERKIAREPAYQTKAPRYCLLAFGPEAKARVWLVQDGDVLYVDRDGSGDLTAPGKRVRASTQGDQVSRTWVVGNLKVGGLTHTGLTVRQMGVTQAYVANDREWQRVQKSNPKPCSWWVQITAERGPDDKRDLPRNIGYLANGDGAGLLLFAGRPQDAPVIHLNGPFTLGLQDWKQKLIAGEKTMLQVGVGPRGVGPGTFAFVLYPNTIPDVHPRAEITFPARPAKGPVLKRTYTLKQRC
jgi:hypothetical protein